MIQWIKGAPAKIMPGMLLHYKCWLVELVGSQRYITTGEIQAHYSAVPVYWLEWIEGLANKKELGYGPLKPNLAI